MISFSGWSILGSLANVGKTNVINILLNIFEGVFVNASMGIANQLSNALNNFVANFQIAYNPQIVKSYASNEKNYLFQLIFQTSKMSFFLLYFLSLPVLINTDLILILWLKIIPDYTVIFCRLTIIYFLIETISGPLWMSVQATGKIKIYQIVISFILLLNIPISYFLLKLNYPPYYVLWVNIVIGILAFMVRIIFLKILINLPVIKFLREVLLSIIIVTITSLPIPFIINHYTHGLCSFLISSLSAFIFTGIFILLIGLKKQERQFIQNKVFFLLSQFVNGQKVFFLRKKL
jgi:hypothetical protein